MYNEPMTDKDTNAQMAKRVELKMAEVAKRVTDESQTDAEFLSNLHDLCVLNSMSESHAGDVPTVEEEKTT